MASSSFSSTSATIKSGGLIFLVLGLTMLWTGAVAQSSCNNVILNLAPCLTYVTSRGSGSPSSSCCSSLATVVRTQPMCLCTVLHGGGSIIGITIDRQRALALPGACNVQTPPVSLCDAINGAPAPAPAILPAASSEPTTSSLSASGGNN